MDKPMVNNNEINYFLPGPNDDNVKRVSTKSQSNYKEIAMMF